MKQRVVMFMALLLAAAGVFAEEMLSLERMRELALAHSTTLAKYNLNMKINVLDEKLQKYNMYPSLSLGATAKVNLWDSNGIKTDTIKNSFSLGLNAGISQTIYDGGKNAVRNSIAKITSEITRQDAAAAYYAALDAADSAYYGMLEALAALESAESALEAAVLALSVAEIRMQNRMMSEADYLEALAEKETRENARNQARRDISLAGAKIKNLCGLSAVPALEGIDFAGYEAGITKSAALEDQQIETLYALLWKKVIEKNPAIAKAVLNSQSAEKQTNLAKRDYVPTLSANFSPGGLSYTIDGGMNYSQGSLSLTGSIPLDFWVTSANVQKKKLAGEQIALDLASAGDQAELELQTAVLNLISQAGTVLSCLRTDEYARKHFDYVMELYKLSQSSQKDLSDATTLLRNNRNQLNNARYGFLKSLSTLRSLGAFEEEEDILTLIKEL